MLKYPHEIHVQFSAQISSGLYWHRASDSCCQCLIRNFMIAEVTNASFTTSLISHTHISQSWEITQVVIATLWWFNIAIENGLVEIVSFAINSMVIFTSHVNVCQRLYPKISKIVDIHWSTLWLYLYRSIIVIQGKYPLVIKHGSGKSSINGGF